MRPSLQLPPNFGPLDDPEAEDPLGRFRASSSERPAPDLLAFSDEPKNMPTVIRCAPGVLDDPEAEDPFTFAGLEEEFTCEPCEVSPWNEEPTHVPLNMPAIRCAPVATTETRMVNNGPFSFVRNCHPRYDKTPCRKSLPCHLNSEGCFGGPSPDHGSGTALDLRGESELPARMRGDHWEHCEPCEGLKLEDGRSLLIRPLPERQQLQDLAGTKNRRSRSSIGKVGGLGPGPGGGRPGGGEGSKEGRSKLRAESLPRLPGSRAERFIVAASDSVYMQRHGITKERIQESLTKMLPTPSLIEITGGKSKRHHILSNRGSSEPELQLEHCHEVIDTL